jgi:hypothetical protein
MILDTQLILSENQAITATAISTNVVQNRAMGRVPGEGAVYAPRNLGAGNEIPLLIQVTANFATLTSLTITFESADNAALSTNPVVHYSSGAIPVATLIAGYRLPIRWLPDATLKEFMGIRYTVGGSNATTGTITAAIGTEVNT